MSFSKISKDLKDSDTGFTSVKEQLKETMSVSQPEKSEKIEPAEKQAPKEKKPVAKRSSKKKGKSRFTREQKKTVTKSFSVGRYVIEPLEQEADDEEMSVSQLLTDILSERYFGETFR